MHGLPDSMMQDWSQAIAETEMALIGGMIMNPSTISTVALTGLTEEHFGDLSCAALWRRIMDIVARGGAVDHRSVLQGGATAIMGEGATLDAFNAAMMRLAARPAMMGEYATIVRSAWVVRRIFDAADGARSQLAAADVIALAKSLIETVDTLRDAAIERRGASRGSLTEIANLVGAEAQAMLQGKLERPPSTGLTDLDKHLPMRGLAAGSLYALAGRTGMGKTLMGAALSSKLCQRGEGVINFSLEVPSREIAARIICERLGGKGPTYGDVLAGHTTDHELEMFMWAARQSDKEPLRIDDSAGLSMSDIMIESKKFADRLDRNGQCLRLVLIDHAMLVKASGRYAGNRVNELGEIANSAKVLAKDLACTVILCCQLARAIESREDKRPVLADLRASGEIEEAADAVLMLYREVYYLERTQAYRNGDPAAEEAADAVRNNIEIGIEKSRQGQTGRVTLWCDPGRSIVSGLHGAGP
jgi:replicative DNA helicase